MMGIIYRFCCVMCLCLPLVQAGGDVPPQVAQGEEKKETGSAVKNKQADAMFKLLGKGPVSLPVFNMMRFKGIERSVHLTAQRVVVHENQQVTAHVLNVCMFGKDGNDTHLETQAATYSPSSQLVVSHEPTKLYDQMMSVQGQGTYTQTAQKRGVILGPVTTTLTVKGTQ